MYFNSCCSFLNSQTIKDNTVTYSIQILCVFYIFMWLFFLLYFLILIFDIFETRFLCVVLELIL